MLQRMPEDNGRPLSNALLEIDDLDRPYIQAHARRLVALLKADRDPPTGYQRLEQCAFAATNIEDWTGRREPIQPSSKQRPRPS